MSPRSKIGKFCYMIRSHEVVTTPHVTRSIYFANLHAHLRYGLIFWGGDSKSKIIFKLQKRINE
jgi:hypothetical protein